MDGRGRFVRRCCLNGAACSVQQLQTSKPLHGWLFPFLPCTGTMELDERLRVRKADMVCGLVLGLPASALLKQVSLSSRSVGGRQECMPPLLTHHHTFVMYCLRTVQPTHRFSTTLVLRPGTPPPSLSTLPTLVDLTGTAPLQPMHRFLEIPRDQAWEQVMKIKSKKSALKSVVRGQVSAPQVSLQAPRHRASKCHIGQ